MFLDAECAWYGDPAFDLAFCLNHFLLKCLWTPTAITRFLACYDRFADAYLSGATWEPREDIEARAALLLPGLLLARVDGKSPVEYLQSEVDKDAVRTFASALVAEPVERPAEVAHRWLEVAAR